MVTIDNILISYWIALFILFNSLFIFTVCFIFLWAFSKFTMSPRPRLYLIKTSMSGLPLGLIGAITGFLTGSSRAPAVAALIPAILSFMGLMIIYLLGRRSNIRTTAANFSVIVFSLSLLVGATMGTYSRQAQDRELTLTDYLKKKSEVELLVRKYRESLGLPPNMSEFDTPKGKKED